MKISRKHTLLYILTLFVGIAIGGFIPASAQVDSAIKFASNSKLSSGRWIQISVTSTGMHRISAAQLSQMGFSDPKAVKIYGYGGNRLSEELTAESVIDDLPQTPSIVTSDGLVFYAVGPQKWTETAEGSGRFTHSNNPYTLKGYYYLTDSRTDERVGAAASEYAAPTDASNASTSYREHTTHHLDNNSLGYSGFTFVGEDMKATPNVNFSIALPGVINETQIWAKVEGAAKTSATAYFTPTFTPAMSAMSGNGSITIFSSESNEYIRGRVASAEFVGNTGNADKLDVKVSFTGGGAVTRAFLHYVDVSYDRVLRFDAASKNFRLRTAKGALASATGSTAVWDVTNPLEPVAMRTTLIGNSAVWNNPAPGLREYAAFDPNGNLPGVTFERQINNQNLHALANADMVIFTLPDWIDAAERLAAYRRATSGLSVHVIDINYVYHEFSSGMPDAQAFRRLLKMLYNREGSTLQYALFFGRPIWDFRRVTGASTTGECAYPAMPSWQTVPSSDEFVNSYTTDDIYGFLTDGSTSEDRRAEMKIAVGRLPAISSSMAHAAVDKIIAHERSSKGEWRSKVVLVADASSDARSFMSQSDDMVKRMREVSPEGLFPGTGFGLTEQKIYLDAYNINNGKSTGAINDLRSALDEGVAWLSYIGHASQTAWGGLGIMPYEYATSMSLRRKPMVIAGTCEYAQFDGPIICGAEGMWRNPQGPIAIIASTRPAAVSTNGNFMAAAARAFGRVRPDGRGLTLGEVAMYAKNELVSSTSTAARSNAARYVVIGDPAMPQVIPYNAVHLTTIHDLSEDKDLDFGGDTPPYIKGGSRIRFSGEVTDACGTPLPDFNGEISLTLYDAIYDVQTLAHDINAPYTMTLPGGKLAMSRAIVKDGKWEAEMQVPLEIANNNTPAALTMYALGYNNATDALGTSREFTVSGFTSIEADKQAPVIKSIYLNHPSFVNGQIVDASPTFYASMADNVSINLSSSGVGRGMTLKLDGDRTYSDLPGYFTPDFGASTSGAVSYPLRNLEAGEHTLTLTVWDTSDNMSQATISFMVDDSAAPGIIDVYTDANPASTSANFYITHDRPDKDVMIGIEIYDIAGRKIWTKTQKSYSDGNVSEPITWNLTTGGGSKVTQGVYIYRATLSMPNGESYSSRSRKLAVTAR